METIKQEVPDQCLVCVCAMLMGLSLEDTETKYALLWGKLYGTFPEVPMDLFAVNLLLASEGYCFGDSYSYLYSLLRVPSIVLVQNMAGDFHALALCEEGVLHDPTPGVPDEEQLTAPSLSGRSVVRVIEVLSFTEEITNEEELNAMKQKLPQEGGI